MLSLVCSCEDEKIQQPEFVLETPEISISAEGGNYEILYSIKNPSEDGKVLPETACQWISELDASLAGVISFVAESNYDSEPREAIVSIAYEGETYEVTLKQGTEELPEVPVFSFEVDNIKETSLEFSIFPADKEMTYIGMLNEKSYIDQFATDEEYFADDMSFF